MVLVLYKLTRQRARQIAQLPPFPSLNPALTSSSSATSTMGYVRDGAVFLDKNVEPVRIKVPGHHAARLDDTRLLREVRLAECLEKDEFVSASPEAEIETGLQFRTKAHHKLSCRPACSSTPASCHCPCCRRSLRERREACWASFVGSECVFLWKYTAVNFWIA